MITVRTRRKSFMTQEQLAGRHETEFILSLGKNFLAFVDSQIQMIMKHQHYILLLRI